jgi:hypothetical protein
MPMLVVLTVRTSELGQGARTRPFTPCRPFTRASLRASQLTWSKALSETGWLAAAAPLRSRLL